MAMDTQQLYAHHQQAALDLIRTELTALEMFLRVTREATACGDLQRAARNRALAAAAVDGARKIANSEANVLRRLASHQLALGGQVAAAALEEHVTELEHRLDVLI